MSELKESERHLVNDFATQVHGGGDLTDFERGQLRALTVRLSPGADLSRITSLLEATARAPKESPKLLTDPGGFERGTARAKEQGAAEKERLDRIPAHLRSGR